MNMLIFRSLSRPLSGDARVRRARKLFAAASEKKMGLVHPIQGYRKTSSQCWLKELFSVDVKCPDLKHPASQAVVFEARVIEVVFPEMLFLKSLEWFSVHEGFHSSLMPYVTCESVVRRGGQIMKTLDNSSFRCSWKHFVYEGIALARSVTLGNLIKFCCISILLFLYCHRRRILVVQTFYIQKQHIRNEQDSDSRV